MPSERNGTRQRSKPSLLALDSLLRTASGIATLVEDGLAETDNVEFKRTLNRRDPRWDEDLRADCAGLATTGCGFMVVGIDETRDGSNRARVIAPLADAADIKKAAEDRLGEGLSPPLSVREVWSLVIPGNGDVLIIRVEGRRGYPIEVVAKREPPRAVVREAGKNKWLGPDECRIRRRELDGEVLRWPQIKASVALGLVVALGLALLGGWVQLKLRPVVTATAVVEGTTQWNPGQGWSGSYEGDGGGIMFTKAGDLVMLMRATRGRAWVMAPDVVKSTDYFDLSSPTSRGARRFWDLEASDELEMALPSLKGAEGKVFTGSITLTINSDATIQIPVRQQTIGVDGRIEVLDLNAWMGALGG